ncbi:MAG: ferritin family protein [Candidatus Kuenenia sp.]|nr:ferritin family protein [Candidatus Kuenenia hertensis]
MSNDAKDIKSIALQMEMDGVKFYSDLANKTLHPIGKAMFRSFAEDEKQHIKRIQALLPAEKESIPSEEKVADSPKERLITVFQSMGDELKKTVTVSTNDIEAVKLAIKLEEEGLKFYEKAANESTDEKEKKSFHFLAEEEKIHLNVLKNTLEYIEDKERWEAEKEGRIYDLWMDMINKKI